jgi:hypothetical protein
MKAMVGIVIAILVIFTINLFWPFNSSDIRNRSLNEGVKTESVNSELTEVENVDLPLELNTPSDDEKVKLMTAEFEILEQERTKLKRRLSRLKHEMWGMKFTPDKAKNINEIMMAAHKLIKNPDMLGAFSGVEGIKDEISKIQFANKSIDQVSAMIEEHTSSNKESG